MKFLKVTYLLLLLVIKKGHIQLYQVNFGFSVQIFDIVLTEPLFSLIIFIYLSVIIIYMFFAFCWNDFIPISTFSPKLKPKPTKSFKRFVYPSPGPYTPRHTEKENQVTSFFPAQPRPKSEH